MKEMNLNIGRVKLKNRVMLASGPAGYGMEYEDLLDLTAVGAVVTKTISLLPKDGNPGIRLWETSAGLLNSVGLENVGAEVFYGEKLPALLEAGVKPVVSLACEGREEFAELLEFSAKQKAVDIVELNLSCPNVEEGGMWAGTEPESVAWYVRKALEMLKGAAVIAKLTPNCDDIAALAAAAQDAGAHGITAVNTLLGMDIDLATGRPVFERGVAGLSGPAVLPVALRAVWQVSRAVEIPVLGSGGISSVEDARKFFAAGAAGVQVGTAIFYDPGLPERIARSI